MLNKSIGSLPIWQFAIVLVSILLTIGLIGRLTSKRTEPKI